MSIPSTAITLTTMPNELAVIARSVQDLLVEVEKTQQIFQEEMGVKEKALQEQAALIARLEAQVQQLTANAQQHQIVEQTLQGRVNELTREKSEHLNQIAYQQRGIDAINKELADHKKWREEYYDIIGGLRGRRGFSCDAALAKCRKHRL